MATPPSPRSIQNQSPSPAECLATDAYAIEDMVGELYGPPQVACPQQIELSEELAQEALDFMQVDANQNSMWWNLRRFLDQWQSNGISKVSPLENDNELYGDIVDPNRGITFGGEATDGIPMSGENSGNIVRAFPIHYQTTTGQVGSYQYQRFGTESTIDFQNGNFSTIPNNHGVGSKVISSAEVTSRGTALLQAANGRIYLPTPQRTQVVSVKNGEASLDVFKTIDGLFYVESDKALTLSWSLAEDDSPAEAPSDFKLKQPIPWDKIDEKIFQFIAEIRTANENEKLEKVQALLNYLEGRRQYSWGNPEPGKDLQETAYRFLKNANCGGSNILGADMLAQAGLPIRLSYGLMRSGKMHGWVEVYHGGQWLIVDFTPTIKNTTSDAFTSANAPSQLSDLSVALEDSSPKKELSGVQNTAPTVAGRKEDTPKKSQTSNPIGSTPAVKMVLKGSSPKKVPVTSYSDFGAGQTPPYFSYPDAFGAWGDTVDEALRAFDHSKYPYAALKDRYAVPQFNTMEEYVRAGIQSPDPQISLGARLHGVMWYISEYKRTGSGRDDQTFFMSSSRAKKLSPSERTNVLSLIDQLEKLAKFTDLGIRSFCADARAALNGETDQEE